MGESSDVIALVESQREQIEELLDRVPREMGSLRQQAFFELRRLLATHEAIEQEILRPAVPADTPVGGAGAEDTAALVSTLESVDIESTDFETTFRRLRDTVRSHTAAADVRPHAARFGYPDAERARQATARMRGEVTTTRVPFDEMRQRARAAIGAQPRTHRRGRAHGAGFSRGLRSLTGRVRHRALRGHGR